MESMTLYYTLFMIEDSDKCVKQQTSLMYKVNCVLNIFFRHPNENKYFIFILFFLIVT